MYRRTPNLSVWPSIRWSISTLTWWWHGQSRKRAGGRCTALAPSSFLSCTGVATLPCVAGPRLSTSSSTTSSSSPCTWGSTGLLPWVVFYKRSHIVGYKVDWSIWLIGIKPSYVIYLFLVSSRSLTSERSLWGRTTPWVRGTMTFVTWYCKWPSSVSMETIPHALSDWLLDFLFIFHFV